MSIRKTLVVVVAVVATALALMVGPARAQDPDPYSTSPCEVLPGQELPPGCESEPSDSSSVLGTQVTRGDGTRVLGTQVSRGPTAVTGSDILTLVAVGGVAILAGFGFRTLSRRRVHT